jgi:hypothetical protein
MKLAPFAGQFNGAATTNSFQPRTETQGCFCEILLLCLQKEWESSLKVVDSAACAEDGRTRRPLRNSPQHDLLLNSCILLP